MNDSMEYLRLYGKTIGALAANGDAKAQSIVDFYTIYHKVPHRSAQALLEASIDDFRKAHPEMESAQ